MSVTSRARLACSATSPSSLPRAYLIGPPAVCCYHVYTFTKLHDRHIPNVGVGVRVGVGPMEFQLYQSSRARHARLVVRTSSRRRHEDATRILEGNWARGIPVICARYARTRGCASDTMQMYVKLCKFVTQYLHHKCCECVRGRPNIRRPTTKLLVQRATYKTQCIYRYFIKAVAVCTQK